MNDRKRVVLICFYDRICLSLRALSAKLKQAGHEPYIIFVKEDRAAPIERLKENSIQYQLLWLDQFWGCGEDINPISRQEKEHLCSLISEINPQFVGISSRSVHIDLANRTARMLREVAPDAVFLAGGFGSIISPREYLEAFDYVCVTEGDDGIVPFVEADDFKSVPNIAYLQGDRLVWNEILPPADVDKLPYPDWAPDNKYMIDDNVIKTGQSFYDSRTYDIFATRGCPTSCTYCMACHWDTMLKPYGQKFPKARLRSPRNVIDELLGAKERYDIKFVRFKDDIFGLSKNWLFEFMDLYDRKIGLKFHCLLDERYATEEKVKRLYDSGLRKTTVGIQSGDEGIRRRIYNRQMSDDDIVKYAEMLERIGIQIKYDLIGWSPFENHETLESGMGLLKRLPKSKETAVFELKMFPGSPILQLYQKEKPVSLSTDEYTYWAVLQQLALFSEKAEEAAFDLLQNEKHDLDIALKRFRTVMRDTSENFRVCAKTNIEKGQRITGSQIDLTETNQPGITSAEFYKVIGMIAKLFINQGTLLSWDDLYSSYEGARGRGMN